MELLIRAARSDTRVIETLCTPAAAGLLAVDQLPLAGLVVDAPLAVSHPTFAKTVRAAAVPLLIDPLTPLLLSEQAPDHAWARLPFGVGRALTLGELSLPDAQDRYVEAVIEFQRANGATWLIPPYLYATEPSDPAFDVGLQLLARTARYLDRRQLGLPVVPVFAGSLLGFGPRPAWSDGLDRFLRTAAMLENLRYVAFSWSTSGPGKESAGKLMHLLTAAEHAASISHIISWRQGLYGLALAACGADGYETGAGRGERLHYPKFLADQKPQLPRPEEDEDGPRGSAFVYLGPLGRSVRRKAGTALLSDPRVAGSLVCLHPDTCCPNGPESMKVQWREHAVRARAGELRDLEAIPPNRSWRLNAAAARSSQASLVARAANEVLASASTPVTDRLPDQVFADLTRIFSEMRDRGQTQVA